jgi:hypothetical protein
MNYSTFLRGLRGSGRTPLEISRAPGAAQSSIGRADEEPAILSGD